MRRVVVLHAVADTRVTLVTGRIVRITLLRATSMLIGVHLVSNRSCVSITCRVDGVWYMVRAILFIGQAGGAW